MIIILKRCLLIIIIVIESYIEYLNKLKPNYIYFFILNLIYNFGKFRQFL